MPWRYIRWSQVLGMRQELRDGLYLAGLSPLDIAEAFSVAPPWWVVAVWENDDRPLVSIGTSGRRAVTAETDDIVDAILNIVTTYGNLSIDVSSLSVDEDLFLAGMTSHASVTVMLELETRFDIEFPDDMLRKSTFESVSSIRSAVGELLMQS